MIFSGENCENAAFFDTIFDDFLKRFPQKTVKAMDLTFLSVIIILSPHYLD